jgi:hypothetical protein
MRRSLRAARRPGTARCRHTGRLPASGRESQRSAARRPPAAGRSRQARPADSLQDPKHQRNGGGKEIESADLPHAHERTDTAVWRVRSLPLGNGLLVDAVAPGELPQALLTNLYCSTDCLCRRGAAVKNLAHSASFHSMEKTAPSKPGIKHLAPIGPQGRSATQRGFGTTCCSRNILTDRDDRSSTY